MGIEDAIVYIIILVISVVLHEVAHGWMADRLGDPTARYAGRLTLNPIPHIDPFGSILLPFMLLAVGSPIIFGAAKPVPVDFSNLHPKKLGMALVALAGPLSNYLLAILFIVILKFGLAQGVAEPILRLAALINIFSLLIPHSINISILR
jgi:Zn-dependent protease